MKVTLLQQKLFASVLLVAYMNLLLSCHRYFRPIPLNAQTTEAKQVQLKKLNSENKFFILRQGSKGYALTDVTLDQERMTLTADLGQLSQQHQLYIPKNGKLKYHYARGNHEQVVLQEVHIFTRDTTSLMLWKPHSIALSDISAIEIIEFDKKRTRSSFTIGAIGLTLGTALVFVLIAAATADEKPDPPPPPESSCPYVSSLHADGYKLEGEIYSGSIYPSLQKEDYLPLRVAPVNGMVNLKISNELEEIQHTDVADLVVISHDPGTKVMVDPNGKFYTVGLEETATKAMLNNRADISAALCARDKIACLFKDDVGVRSAEEVVLNFNNDQQHKTARLVLSAKTSSWLNYLYGEFAKGFGGQYARWTKQQAKKPVAELEKWVNDQNIPLTISIKTANGWQQVQQVKTIGPMLNRDVVIPLNIASEGAVQIKLSGGYLFWEVDYAAIDYSTAESFTVERFKPSAAVDEKGADVLPALLKADKNFLVQPNVGDKTVISYNVPACSPGMVQTLFLHSSGYYTHIRDFSGMPKIGFLKSFEKPGALSAFSRQKFAEAWNNIAAVKN